MRPCRLLQVTVGLFGGAGTCWEGHRGRTHTSMGMWVFTVPSATQPPLSGQGGHHGGTCGDNCSVLGFPPGVSSGGSPWGYRGGSAGTKAADGDITPRNRGCVSAPQLHPHLWCFFFWITFNLDVQGKSFPWEPLEDIEFAVSCKIELVAQRSGCDGTGDD